MNVVRCENGHFYDADVFKICPHCKSSINAKTECLLMPNMDIKQDNSMEPSVHPNTENYKLEKRLVVGWLVAIDGILYGDFIPLYEGENDVDGVMLKYDPSMKKVFIDVQNTGVRVDLDARTLSENTYIHHHNRIRFYGNTYVFIELIREGFDWRRKNVIQTIDSDVKSVDIENKWKCIICGSMVSNDETYCTTCGYKREE